MLSYTHFTSEERKCLQKLLDEGCSMRKAAEELGKSPSSVSREIRRNSSKNSSAKNKFHYHHARANALTIHRRRINRLTAIPEGSFKFEYIVESLNKFWSPEEIAMRMRLCYPDQIVGTATIYRYIKKKLLPGITAKNNLRRRGKRKVNRDSNCNTIQPERTIPEWPYEIKNRLEFGHYEGDSVLGSTGKGGIITMVERQSRFILAGRILTKQAQVVGKTIVKMFCGIPVKSISLDNGSEFAAFKEIEKELNIPIYFAEPHKPWQRGTNENTNGLFRFFFEKGCDFREISDEDIQIVVDLLNNRPRKCLGFRTPAEVFYSKCVALA